MHSCSRILKREHTQRDPHTPERRFLCDSTGFKGKTTPLERAVSADKRTSELARLTARIEAMQAEIRENESLDPVLKAARDAHEADVAMEEEKAAAARRAEQAAEEAELWHQADRIVWKSRGEDVMEAQERRKQLEMERKQKERAAKRGVAASAVSSKPAKARPKTDREKREEEQKKAERDREVQAQVDKLRAARLLQEQERKRKEAEMREAEFENSIAELSNGVYEGAFLDGKRHGLGTRRYGNGDVYTGGWKEGKKSGHGTIRFADSSFFSGHFHQGLCLSLSACPPLCVATCLFCCVRVWKRACVSVTCARYAERERDAQAHRCALANTRQWTCRLVPRRGRAGQQQGAPIQGRVGWWKARGVWHLSVARRCTVRGRLLGRQATRYGHANFCKRRKICRRVVCGRDARERRVYLPRRGSV